MPFFDLFWKRVEDWTYFWVPVAESPVEPATAHKCYLTVTLRSMRLVYRKELWKKFHGAVQSVVALGHMSSGKPIEIRQMIAPSEFKDVDPARLDRVIIVNQPLAGPVPYRGGAVSFSIGLMSIAAVEMASPYITLLDAISQAAGVAYVTNLQPFTHLLSQAIERFAEIGDQVRLEVGLKDTWNPPCPGWLAVIASPKNHVQMNAISVDPTDMRLLVEGKPFTEASYLLVELTANSSREDWYQIPDVRTAYEKLQNAIRTGKVAEVNAVRKQFNQTVRLCNDLLLDDAESIIQQVGDTTTRVLSGKLSSAGAFELPELRELGNYRSK